jgi:hypothetical protein
MSELAAVGKARDGDASAEGPAFCWCAVGGAWLGRVRYHR